MCAFGLGPDVAIALGASAKVAGEGMSGENVELFVCNQHRDEMDAYERLIGDAMVGDATLFARQDEVEAAWRIVDPILSCRPNCSPMRPTVGDRRRRKDGRAVRWLAQVRIAASYAGAVPQSQADRR